MMKRLLNGMLVLILTVGAVVGLASQSFAVYGDGAGDGGQFRDKQGKIVAGAKVRITQVQPDGTKKTTETETDDRGFFFLPWTGGPVSQIQFIKDGKTSTFSGPFYDLDEIPSFARRGTDPEDVLLAFDMADSDEEGGVPNIPNVGDLFGGLFGGFDSGSASRGWGRQSGSVLNLFDLTIYGGYGFAGSDPMARSESPSLNRMAESGLGRVSGGKFGGKIRMALPESIVQIPNVWVFFGGENFFGRESTGGRGDFHPGTPDGNQDTSVRYWLEYALDFGLGYSMPCPLGINCQLGVSAGASLVATGLEAKSDETAGSGRLETFKDWNKHVAPFLGVWIYHPLGEFAGVPLNLVAGSDFRYIPMSGASGQSSTFGSSVDYNFTSEGFWDIDPYIGLNVALSDFVPCVLGF